MTLTIDHDTIDALTVHLTVDPAAMDPVSTAGQAIRLAEDRAVNIALLPVPAARREVAIENLWLLQSLLDGEWTAAHTAHNDIEPMRLTPPFHPVRLM